MYYTPHKKGENGLAKVLERQLKYKSKSPKIREIETPRILIPAYDVYNRNTTWFSNNPPDDAPQWYDNIDLWKICTASASAPTFFPPYNLPFNTEEYLPHIDGGVSANNPSLIAITRALELNQELNLSNIAVLSIGTGKTTSPYKYEDIKKWGALNWAQNIPNLFMDPSAINSEEICRRMVTIQGGSYLRLSFDLNKQFKKREQYDRIKELLDEEPYNEYILEDKKNKIPVSEEMDDPSKCPELIGAAESYLKTGTVYEYKEGKDIFSTIPEAIEQFIDSNSDPDSNSN